MNCPLCSSGKSSVYIAEFWLCSQCQLVWRDPRNRVSPEKEKARYSTHENPVSDPAYMNYLHRTAGPVVAQVPAGAYGLDYGCGPSEGMKTLLSPLGYRVESYDPFFYPTVHLLNNRYDFVLCSEAAEHFFHPLKEFEIIDTALKPGGVLGVSSVLAVEREKFANWYYQKDYTHVVFYQRATVEWLAEHFGWELLMLENPLWIFRKNH